MNNKRRPPRSLKPVNDEKDESFLEKYISKSKIIKYLNDFFQIREDRDNKNEKDNLILDYGEYINNTTHSNYETYLEEEFLDNYKRPTKPSKSRLLKNNEKSSLQNGQDNFKSESFNEEDLRLSKINKAQIKNKTDHTLLNEEKIKNKKSNYKVLSEEEINKLSYPRLKEEKRKGNKSFLKRFTSKIEEYEKTGSFGFNLTKYEKNKIGIIIFIVFFLIIIGGSYYLFIYEPGLNELNKEKNTKLDQVNLLFKGPLTSSKEAILLEDEINNCSSIMELEKIDVLRPATTEWKDYHLKKINESVDSGGRVMLSSVLANRKNIINIDEAKTIVQDNDGNVLSNIEFEKPNTVAVPLQVSRLQACDGLITTGSKIDIYCINTSEIQTSDDGNNIENSSMIYNNTPPNNITNQSTYGFNSELSQNLNETTSISGCRVLAIIRSKESGTINSEMSETYSFNSAHRNITADNSHSYSDDVLEDLKTYAIDNYSSDLSEESLNEYGIKLSEYERESNLGDLNCEYLILIEIPREDVQYTLNNMNNLILTIPTQDGPDWMIEEIKESGNGKNENDNFTIF